MISDKLMMIKPYISKNNIKIYQGCALEVLKEIEDKSVDMVMTSPPYWGLRDYGTAKWEGGNINCEHIMTKLCSDKSTLAGYTSENIKLRTNVMPYKDTCGKCGARRVDSQLGLEPTYQEYIDKLVVIFDEVKRVLKDTGSCWVNLGDTYSTVSGSMGDSRFKQPKYEVAEQVMNFRQPKTDLQSKSLIGIPERFAIAMQDTGWIRRNTIIWYKSNCMPSSANDRFTVDFEYLYFFTKKPQYYFEQQFEGLANPERTNFQSGSRAFGANKDRNDNDLGERSKTFTFANRNKRCVWQLSTEPYPEAHFATYPEKLCETPIKAGCPSHICKKCGKAREKIVEKSGGTTGTSWHDHSKDKEMGMHQSIGGLDRQGEIPYNVQFKGYTDCGCNAGYTSGVVMDIFMGSGTTLKVARELGRKGIGIELNQEYIEMAIKRINLKQTLLEFS